MFARLCPLTSRRNWPILPVSSSPVRMTKLGSAEMPFQRPDLVLMPFFMTPRSKAMNRWTRTVCDWFKE